MKVIYISIFVLCLTSGICQVYGQECTVASDCPLSDAECHVCEDGYGPSCPEATCIDGICGVIDACSECSSDTPTTTATDLTTTHDDTCTDDDTSRCHFDFLCAMCLEGYSPGCIQATCVNGRCKLIQPCSIYTPTKSTTPSTTSISDFAACQDASGCAYPEYCATECKQGLGPLCASAKCVDGQCVTIHPCSETLTCTDDDVSHCLINQACAKCAPGYSPGCTQATCQNGQCQIITPCSIFNPSDVSTTTISTNDQCQSDAQCAYLKQCVSKCDDGLGPLCAFSKCINGQCIITPTCSLKIECTDSDISQCAVPLLCRRCLPGYSPDCSQAVCDNGFCRTIPPCSIYTPATTPDSTTTSEPICRKDLDCQVKGYCVDQCPIGFGPQCTTFQCTNGQCVITQPCSLKNECSQDDLSRCIIPMICADCKPGYSPPCAQARCDQGRCNVTMPCSIYLDAPTKTTTTVITRTMITRTVPTTTSAPCTRHSQCVIRSICVESCKNGTTPLCGFGKCVAGKCVEIRPCSQKTCKVANDCAYNKKNCMKCNKSYGPECEQPLCKCGICSLIAPCSKKITVSSPISLA